MHDRGAGIVNTVGCLDGSRPRGEGYLPATHVNLGEYWRMRSADGYVLQDDGATRSAVVHQYDRFDPEINGLVAKLNCNGCWPPPSRAAIADDSPGPAPG